MSYDIITSLNDFKPLQPVYNELLEDLRNRHGCYTPQLSHEWLATYWEYLAGDAKVEILVHKDKDGKIVGFSPFMTKRLPGIRGQLGLTQLTFLTDDKTDCCDIVLHNDHRSSIIVNELQTFLANKEQVVHRIYLRRIRHASPNWRIFKRLWQGQFRPSIENMICRLGKSKNDYFTSIGSSVRKEIRQKWKRISESYGSIKVEYVDSINHQYLQQLMKVDQCRAGNTEHNSTISNILGYEFAHEVLRLLADRNEFCGWILWADNEPAAYRLGFLTKNTFQGWQTSYNLKYSEYSPGKLLTAKAIEDCFTKNITCFDFLCGEKTYKIDWCNDLEVLYAYEWQANTFRSRLVNAGGAVKRLVFP